jgi:thymidylate kinase
MSLYSERVSLANETAIALPGKPVIRSLLRCLEDKGVRYCHWKSNIRLEETLAAAEDIDLLVDRRDAGLFHVALLANGFKLAQSRSGIGHPGVFHALALDEASAELVHLHAYFQIVSGDSLVKNYRLPIEDVLLERTRYLQAVRVPAPEAELVLFALRMALKHVSPVEMLMANRHYGQVSGELAWLRQDAKADDAEAFCAAWFPHIEPALFRELLGAIATDRAVVRRVLLGWRISWRLRGLRRLNPVLAATSRLWRVLSMLGARLVGRKDLALQTGGMIVALVGPKATGKSTISQALTARLGQNLHVLRIHAGKPPATVLTWLPRLLVPAARKLLSRERAGEYEKPERRREKQYSLLYVLRMMLLAYDRQRLLRRALRAATAGAIVISDRYPSQTVAAIDSSCFDEGAVAKCGSTLKRWLMNKERALYTGLPRPGLVLRLIAPLHTTIERDARRLKNGGPDSEAVQRRWELESQAEFSGTPVIHIDTDRPIDETVRTAIGAVWAAL